MKTLLAVWKNYRAQAEYRAKVRQTIKELSALTNQELWDIGISRGEIYSIARSAPKPEKIEAEATSAKVNSNIEGWV